MASLFLLAGCSGTSANHDHGDNLTHLAKSTQPEAPAVVPTAEKSTAQALMLDGPKETKGINSVLKLAKIELGEEFKGMEGQQLRVRELVIAPGGIVAVHQHNKRPGVAYIIEGEMTEHRDGEKNPIVHTAGSVAVEHTGVSHWWENKGEKPARALIIDILPTP